eukprot:gene7796-990_t
MSDSLEEPLLQPSERHRAGLPRWRLIVQAFWSQMRIAVPLTVNMVTIRTIATVNLMFVTTIGGTQQLAATALGNTLSIMFAKLVLMGLCGGLDTQAAQSWCSWAYVEYWTRRWRRAGAHGPMWRTGHAGGAGLWSGKLSLLPIIFQRCLLFLLAHCFAICGFMLLLPTAMRHLCSDPALGEMAGKFVLYAIPSVWLDACDFEYLGAALSLSFASALDLLLTLAYVIGSGRGPTLLGRPSKLALKGWLDLAKLSYPACFMKCAESWAFTLMTLVACLLPDPSVAVAAVGVAFNVYGMLYMVYLALCMAACAQVGNRLGAGDAEGAQAATIAAVMVSPMAWSIAAVILLLPVSQRTIIQLFEAPGVDARELELVLSHLLNITALLVLLDGTQTIMSGVIQGLGAQRRGAAVNGLAFYGCAVPLALFLAFKLKLGPEGLYLGMVAGPLIQTCCYTWILLKTNWEAEARTASARHFGIIHGGSQDALFSKDGYDSEQCVLVAAALLHDPSFPSFEEVDKSSRSGAASGSFQEPACVSLEDGEKERPSGNAPAELMEERKDSATPSGSQSKSVSEQTHADDEITS